MRSHKKKASKQRNERHSAVWGGKPVVLLVLILLANLAFAQPQMLRPVQDDGGLAVGGGKVAPDLAQMLISSRGLQRVIVQYKNAPTASQVSKVQAMGATLHNRLALVKGGSEALPTVGGVSRQPLSS